MLTYAKRIFSILILLFILFSCSSQVDEKDLNNDIIEPSHFYIKAAKLLPLKANTFLEKTIPSTTVLMNNESISKPFKNDPITFSFSNKIGTSETIKLPISVSSNSTTFVSFSLIAALLPNSFSHNIESSTKIPLSIKTNDNDFQQLSNNPTLLKTWVTPIINETINISLQTDPYTKFGTYNGIIGFFIYMNTHSESPSSSNMKASYSNKGLQINGILVENLPNILNDKNAIDSTKISYPLNKGLILTFSETDDYTAKSIYLNGNSLNINQPNDLYKAGINHLYIESIDNSSNSTTYNHLLFSLPENLKRPFTEGHNKIDFKISSPNLIIDEGKNKSFAIELSYRPEKDVVLNIKTTNVKKLKTSVKTVTFTPTNWNVPQSITVTNIEDDLVDGTISSNITIAVIDYLSDDAFDSLQNQTVSVATIDNDSAGFTLSKTSQSVTEAGGTDSFTLVLKKGPTSNVVLNLNNSDTGEATVSPANITFTSANWNTPQTVTVTGIDDTIVDGSQSTIVTIKVDDDASNDSFDNLVDQTVTITTTDDESAGFTLGNIANKSVSETGNTDTFTVVLTAKPTTPVVLDITSSDTSEATVSPTSLTFTSVNWSTPQTLTLTGIDDNLIDGNINSTITISVDANQSDNTFDSLQNQTVSVSTLDNDSPGFALSKKSLSVSETGTSQTFTILLYTQPQSNVIFSITSSDTSETAVSPATMTFTPGNWNTAQTVTVRGQDDSIVDGTQSSTVTVSVVDNNSDDNFDNVVDQTVSVSTSDNDLAGFNISSTSLTVSESGTSQTFAVTLNAQPTSDVVLRLISNDTGEATVSPTSLTFTSVNWNSAQIVTVTGQDDSIVDGTQSTTVMISVVDNNSDDNFDNVVDQTVTVTTTDNDVAGFNLSKTSQTVTEAGGTDTFTVTLNAQPASDVVLNLNSADTGEATVNPASITFTSGNWNTPQTVTVTGVDDSIKDGTQTTVITMSVVDASSDDNFDNVVDQTVTVTTTDDDSGNLYANNHIVSVNNYTYYHADFPKVIARQDIDLFGRIGVSDAFLILTSETLSHIITQNNIVDSSKQEQLITSLKTNKIRQRIGYKSFAEYPGKDTGLSPDYTDEDNLTDYIWEKPSASPKDKLGEVLEHLLHTITFSGFQKFYPTKWNWKNPSSELHLAMQEAIDKEHFNVTDYAELQNDQEGYYKTLTTEFAYWLILAEWDYFDLTGKDNNEGPNNTGNSEFKLGTSTEIANNLPLAHTLYESTIKEILAKPNETWLKTKYGIP